MPRTEKLKPCPFCGGKAKAINSIVGVKVGCRKCAATFDWEFKTKNFAVRYWNRRAK